jgi:fatty acid desaturase
VTFLFAVVMTLATMNATHDCSHFSVTNKPWVWRLLGAWHDFINGISETVWIYQHTLGHHPYTNVDHADPDIVTAANELPDLRRIKETQTWLPRYFYQHFYMPLLYGLLAVKTRIQEFYILFLFRKNGTIRVNRLSAMQWFLYFGGKIFFYTYRIVIPLLAGMPVWQLLSITVACDMFSSYYLALIFQVSHVNSNVKWPLPDENNVVHADWWKLQILTTQDYSTDSWFVTFMTGALNHQTAHHVFPGIAQCYLPIVTPIVKKTCEDFGVQYNYCGTLWDALSSHVGHLKRLGSIDKSGLSNQEVSVMKEKTY